MGSKAVAALGSGCRVFRWERECEPKQVLGRSVCTKTASRISPAPSSLALHGNPLPRSRGRLPRFWALPAGAPVMCGEHDHSRHHSPRTRTHSTFGRPFFAIAPLSPPAACLLLAARAWAVAPRRPSPGGRVFDQAPGGGRAGESIRLALRRQRVGRKFLTSFPPKIHECKQGWG